MLRTLNQHGANLTLPACLSHDGEPEETLAHLAVEHDLDVLGVLRDYGAAMDTRRRGEGAVGAPTPLWDACASSADSIMCSFCTRSVALASVRRLSVAAR